MRRFITYIYEYEHGNRGRNIGFVRTDLRENNCRMELQIRGLDRFKGKCPVYLTVYENGLQAIPVSELLLTQGMGTCSFLCENNKIGDSGFAIHQAQTLTISCGNGRFLIGCLSASPVPEAIRGEFSIFQKEISTPTASPASVIPPKSSGAQSSESVPIPQTKSAVPTEISAPAQNNAPTEIPTPVEIPVPAENPAPAQKPAVTESIQQAAQQEPAPQPKISYQKIEIPDIRKLPKSNWNLCNNRFLLHGFFNYHYLMLKTLEIDGEKQQFLGVPGIYEQPERMMAMLFGFPEFEAASTAPEDMTGVFGYWICPLN